MAVNVDKKRTTMRFQNGLLKKLDAHATKVGLSRTMLLHEIVRNWLEVHKKDKAPVNVTIFD